MIARADRPPRSCGVFRERLEAAEFRRSARRRAAVSLLEMLVAAGIFAAVLVPALVSVVSSRSGLAGTWNEAVARSLAAEAVEWACALPTDSILGPVVLDEPVVTAVSEVGMLPGGSLAAPRFSAGIYRYPAAMGRFSRRIEITDASPAPEAPLLRVRVTVGWREAGAGGGVDRDRTLTLWRLLAP